MLWRGLALEEQMTTQIQYIYNVKSMTADARENLREQAYEGFRNNETAYAVSKRLKVRKSTVYRWFNEFEARSEKAIKERKRGAEISGHAALSKKERMQLIKDITDKTPEQLKFEFALWSSKAIKDYVHRMFGIEISRRTARRYMKALGFTYQCPVRRAKEQNSKAVAQWLEHTYPSIKTQAAKNKATIMWADETANMVGAERRAGFSPRGKTPVLRTPDKRKIRCNSISAIANNGELEFMFFDDSINADIFKTFCEKLTEKRKNAVYLIVDNLRVHHAKVLSPWFEEQKTLNKLFIFYLPSYSPELNPDEYLNRDIKAHLAEKSIPKSKQALQNSIRKHLNNRKRNKGAVKALFLKEEVLYAS